MPEPHEWREILDIAPVDREAVIGEVEALVAHVEGLAARPAGG